MFYFNNPNIRSYRLTFSEENSSQITIGFIESTNEIVYISKYNAFPKNSSYDKVGNKGLYLGDKIEKVIKIYGKNYYSYGKNKDDPKGIGYIDRKNRLHLTFLYDSQNLIYSYSIEAY